jgi:hypothetical protein
MKLIPVPLTRQEVYLLIETVADRKFNTKSNPTLEAELVNIKRVLADAVMQKPRGH